MLNLERLPSIKGFEIFMISLCDFKILFLDYPRWLWLFLLFLLHSCISCKRSFDLIEMTWLNKDYDIIYMSA